MAESGGGSGVGGGSGPGGPSAAPPHSYAWMVRQHRSDGLIDRYVLVVRLRRYQSGLFL